MVVTTETMTTAANTAMLGGHGVSAKTSVTHAPTTTPAAAVSPCSQPPSTRGNDVDRAVPRTTASPIQRSTTTDCGGTGRNTRATTSTTSQASAPAYHSACMRWLNAWR